MAAATLRNKRPFVVLTIFLAFLLLHQADKLLIGQVLEDIQRDFAIDDAAAGALGAGALIVAALGYPIWGYLFDRHARPKLLALASVLWGLTTALSAVVTTFPAFLITRGSTGIDDSSYPGLFSLTADYFSPKTRGKVNGLLQLTGPFGFMLSLGVVLALKSSIGWRNIFLLTGASGIVIGILIRRFVRDVQRGASEPEMADRSDMPTFKLDWPAVRALLKRRTLYALFLQGFFGVFPFNVVQFWFFVYLGRERNYDETTIFWIMIAAALSMSVGTVVAGAAGDALFRRIKQGRLLVCLTGVLVSAVLLLITLNLPSSSSPLLFGTALTVTAFFTLFSGPNIVATIYDIALPEVRTTALAAQYFIENIGAASAPLLVGLFSASIGLSNAIMLICVSTLALCGVFLAAAVALIPKDITALRQEMQERARLGAS
ncbi:MAG: MFS transporter [Anaerolineae bacterium]|nr:MFS transporter [Anaerolineae bacterium]